MHWTAGSETSTRLRGRCIELRGRKVDLELPTLEKASWCQWREDGYDTLEEEESSESEEQLSEEEESEDDNVGEVSGE